MNDSPLVSIILPVYNGEKYIAAAIESVLNQTYTNFELLVINDASKDRTAEILESFVSRDSRVRVYTNESNLKLIKTLNKGLHLANGELIARFDADDICLSERLFKQVTFMKQNPAVGAVGSDFLIFSDENGRNQFPPPISKSFGEIRWELLFGSPLAHPTVMMRRSTLRDTATSYDESFIHAEDYQMWVRLAEFSEIQNIDEPLIRYRKHSQSISALFSDGQMKTSARLIQNEIFRRIGIVPSDACARLLLYNRTIVEVGDLSEIKKIFKLLYEEMETWLRLNKQSATQFRVRASFRALKLLGFTLRLRPSKTLSISIMFFRTLRNPFTVIMLAVFLSKYFWRKSTTVS